MISYDISGPKRLSQAQRTLKKAGLPLQYSVFTVVYSQTRLECLLDSLDRIIDPQEDDVRCYVLPTAIDCKSLGRQLFPDDVLLAAGGVN